MSPRPKPRLIPRSVILAAIPYLLFLALVIWFIVIQRWVAQNAVRIPNPSSNQIYPVEIGSRYHHITGYVTHRLYRWYWISIVPALALMLASFCFVVFVGLRALRRMKLAGGKTTWTDNS
jgi:hypothetical protein